MTKFCTDGFLDPIPAKLATATRYTVTAGQPTNMGEVVSLALASAALTGANFATANGDVSGRKSTCTPPTDIAITASGSADHCVIDDGTDFYVTTVPAQVLTAGGTVTPAAHDIEIADPQ